MRLMQARRYPVGAEVGDEGVRFRVWAPRRKRVSVVMAGTACELAREEDQYFSVLVPGVGAGARYGFRLDGDAKLFPDPASRWQPDGPHGLSAVVDPHAFAWSDASWQGVPRDDVVVSEIHIGTFSEEGTWAGAERHLQHLRDVGITMLEIMPVHEFPGLFGWGYDGVDLWAPTRLYGTPDDFRHFVDAAHRAGLGVLLDVVYNHFGPDGNYLTEFSSAYFTDRYPNDWGQSVNFDGDDAGEVREFFASNAAYWIDEFHLDGLRIDAAQSIIDLGPEHILGVIGRRARQAGRERSIYLTVENETQDIRMVAPLDDGGCALDSMWNDDFHHAARVALTGRIDGYFHDYRGTPQELLSMAKHGFLYQGQWYSWQKQPRGTPSIGWPPRTFVWYLQNHDQIANSAFGERLHELTDAASFRAATGLLLLGPATPMLFQGQEFGASAPFLYFADHEPELAALVHAGRKKFLGQFDALVGAAVQEQLPAPHDPDVFRRCRIDWSERERNTAVLDMHRDLLRIRRENPPFPAQDGAIDGAVLGERCFLLRSLRRTGDDQLLIVNLGGELRLEPMKEPLLAPPSGRGWSVAWSSESRRYGGSAAPVWDVHGKEGSWRIPPRCTLLFQTTSAP